MTDEDIFRQVQEDLRREQLKAYWDKFGVFIIGGAMAIIIAVAGYKGWNAWSDRQAGTAGAQFVEAQTLIDEGKTDAAGKAFEKLIKEAPHGYRTLSTFQLASTKVVNGKNEEAVKLYDDLAKNGGLDPVLKGFAQIQAAMLIVDKADLSEVKKRLGGMTVSNNYWRHSARELLGLAAFNATKLSEAKGYYDAIIKDNEAPRDLKARAEMMLSLINAKQEPDKAKPKAGKEGKGPKTSN